MSTIYRNIVVSDSKERGMELSVEVRKWSLQSCPSAS